MRLRVELDLNLRKLLPDNDRSQVNENARTMMATVMAMWSYTVSFLKVKK